MLFELTPIEIVNKDDTVTKFLVGWSTRSRTVVVFGKDGLSFHAICEESDGKDEIRRLVARRLHEQFGVRGLVEIIMVGL